MKLLSIVFRTETPGRLRRQLFLPFNPREKSLTKPPKLFHDLWSSTKRPYDVSQKQLPGRIAACSKETFLAVTHLGGFPIVVEDGKPTFFGAELTPELVQEQLMNALAASGALTRLSIWSTSRCDTAEFLREKKHFWGWRLPTVTLTFWNYPNYVELSFLRDGRWQRGGSWLDTEGAEQPSAFFTITGSVNDWWDYTRHKDSEDFCRMQKSVLVEVDSVFKALFGELWG